MTQIKDESSRFIQKMYAIAEIINGMPMITERGSDTLYYSVGEAEQYIPKYIAANPDKNVTVTLLEVYKSRVNLGNTDNEYKVMKERITEKYLNNGIY